MREQIPCKQRILAVTKNLPAIAAFTLSCMAAHAQGDLPHFGVGPSASSLGLGIQAATAVTARSNLRVGFTCSITITHSTKMA